MLQAGRSRNAGGYRFGFNGMENDNKKGGLGEHVDFGARGLNTWTTKFYGIDPLWAKYPNMSSYTFTNNSPIAFVDPDGREVYYAADGTYLGKIGTNTKVMVANQADIENVKKLITYSNLDVLDTCLPLGLSYCRDAANKCSMDLGIDNNLLMAFASTIHNESSGDFTESYTFGNIVEKYVSTDVRGHADMTTLEDVVAYDNTTFQGATQVHYNKFIKKSHEAQNERFAVGAAINAVGYNKGLPGFRDYAADVELWDGVDLVKTKTLNSEGLWKKVSNSHRSQVWSSDSRELLEQYTTDRGGRHHVNISTWTFSDYPKSKAHPNGYTRTAVRVNGRTLFQGKIGSYGGHKQAFTRFYR